jgi:tetratricopeptide (TPR) repeat protein
LVKQLYEESRGNPLYLQELLVEAGRPKPRPLPSEKGRLGDLILARFYSLDPEIQALLTTAAVGGEVVHLEALQGAMEMPPQAFHRLLSAAIQRGFLEETGSGHGRVLRFRHRRVRQVLLEQVPDLEQRRLRHLLGLALEKSLGHRRPTHEVYDLAHFFRDGPDLKRAATYLYEAATMADDAYAGSVALEYYRTLTEREGLMEALTPEQRYRVRFRCAYLYYMAGDSGSAIRQLELIDRFPDAASKVRTHAWWSYYLADNLELPRAIRVARRAVALGRGTKEGVYAQSFLVRNLIDANRFDEARTLARRVERAWRRYRWSYHDKLTFATFEVHAAHLSFDLRKVLAKQQDMLKLAQAAEDPIRELRSYQVLMSLYDDLDHPQRSLEYSSRAIDMGKTWKVADAELEAAMQHAQVQARLGTGLTEAIKINDQALHRLKDLGIRWLIPSTVARLVELLPHAGKADEVQKYLEILEEHLGPHGRVARAPLYRYLHALACFAKGEGEEALVHLQAARKAGLDIADVPYTIDLELGLAKAHLLLGRHEKARTHAQKAVDLAPSQRPVRGRSGALMILARCDAAQGRRLKAKERAEEALELLRTCGYTLLEPEAEALLQDLGG